MSEETFWRMQVVSGDGMRLELLLSSHSACAQPRDLSWNARWIERGQEKIEKFKAPCGPVRLGVCPINKPDEWNGQVLQYLGWDGFLPLGLKDIGSYGWVSSAVSEIRERLRMTKSIQHYNAAMTQATTTPVELFLRYMKAEGVHAVFGIPGGLLHPFFVALEQQDEMALIITKHEQGAAFMADGMARVTGKIGVCAGTSGPGSTNLLTGVAVAFADGVPMLVITGQASSANIGRGAVQETGREDIDIVSMFSPITKYSAMVSSPESFSRHLRRALRLAMSGRKGPVHLNVPVDFWARPVPDEGFDYEPERWRPSTQVFEREAVKRAAQALIEADHPVFLAGAGVRAAGAQEQLRILAELVGARVATSPTGKGIFPEDHDLALGVLGVGGHDQARDTLLRPDVDLLMTLGTSLSETTTFNWRQELMPSKCLIQLDIDVDRIGRNYPVDVPLVGDARAILTELFFHVRRLLGERKRTSSRWHEAPPTLRGEARCESPELRHRDDAQVMLSPQRWRAELEEVLPEDVLLFSDVGGHMLFNVHEFELKEEQSFILNMSFGSMGHGTVAPIGAALSPVDRPVVAIIGDACFTMNGMELLTAVEYDVPVIWIVENNQRHGIIWHGSQLVGDKKPMESIVYDKYVDVRAMAAAMGVQTFQVTAPGQMQEAFAAARALKKPCLIDVIVDPTIPPPMAARAATVGGFRK